MDIVTFESNELHAALCALRGLVEQPTREDRRFLSAIAALHGTRVDIDTLRAMPLQTVAEKIPNKHRRKRLLQLAIIFTLIPGTVKPSRLAAVDALAQSLGVTEPALRTLHYLARGRLLLTRISVFKRMIGRFLSRAWRQAGLLGVLGVILPLTGWGADRRVFERYMALERLPRGTLGRELWEHYHENQLTFPGGRGGIPEPVVFHDLGHVLTGLSTTPHDEIRQAAFQAGFVRHDGFGFLFFGILQFHVGVRITPIAKAERGYFDVEGVLRAVARGARCKVDLSDQFDFWAIAGQQVDELREQYGVTEYEPVSWAA